MNDSFLHSDYPRRALSFAVFGFLLIIFINKFFSDSLLHQLCNPVLISPEIDNTYWLVHLLQIPESLTQNSTAAWMFDASIFILIALCLFSGGKNIFSIPLFLFLFVYLIVFNTYAGHHYYFTAGLLFILLPFFASGQKNFDLLYEFVRYVCCFLYASSGLYKLFRGSIFNSGQLSSILMNDDVGVLYHHPHCIISKAIIYLIGHPLLAQSLFILTTIVELAFIIGFFTKKYDLLLLISLVIFHVGISLLLNIPFAEQSVIFLVFVPKEKWNFFSESKLRYLFSKRKISCLGFWV